jgi:hypothetical protein
MKKQYSSNNLTTFIPFFLVFALSNRRAKAFFRPTNIERKNATFSEFDEC